LIRRTMHDGPAYRQDNITVWAIIRHVAHGGPAWAWVSSFARHQNGRAAYRALRTHYFGDSYTTRAVTKADATIENLHWDGRAKNYPLEKFFEQLNKAYCAQTLMRTVSPSLKQRRHDACFKASETLVLMLLRTP